MFARAHLVLVAALAASAAAQEELLRDLHRHFPIDNSASTAIDVGDLDGDGDLDAYCAQTSEQDFLCLNQGKADFELVWFGKVPEKPVFGHDTQALRLGDVDGDGDLDAIHGINSNEPNLLFRNDGSASFTDVSSAAMPTTFESTFDAALADVEGDGDLDVWFVNRGQPFFDPMNVLFLNDGSGVFADGSAQVPAGTADGKVVRFADLDLDGDVDGVVASLSADSAYLNDGSGVFTEVAGAFSVHGTSYTMDVGDVTGDGFPDVVKEGVAFNTLGLFVNDGSGVFTLSAAAIPATSEDPRDAELLDLDGDGDRDLIVANDGATRVYVNDGDGTFSEDPALAIADDDQTQDMATGDADGDGDADLFLANWIEQNRFYFGNGKGLFVDPTALHLPSDHFHSFAVDLGDVDGDGWVDAYVTGGGGAFDGFQDRLLINDGAGALQEIPGLLPVEDDAGKSVALGDVDGNGTLDAVIGVDGQSKLYTNDGAGVFYDQPQAVPVETSETTAVEFGDVDGDGDNDALLGNRLALNLLWRNDVSIDETFADVSGSLPPHADWTADVGFADFDGDGDLDAFLGSAFGQNRLYLNDGGGMFADATSLLFTGIDNTGGVAVGDVDADGDPDVLAANDNPGLTNTLYLNDLAGSGVMIDGTSQLPAVVDRSDDVALADMDGDGDLDAVVDRGNSVVVLVNDGAGSFSDTGGPVSHFAGFNLLDFAVADLDRDGDPDVVAAVPGTQDRLFHGTARHVAWREIPRTGKDLTMDVYGPAGEPFVLGFAQGTGLFEVPPYGTFLLDLPTFQHLTAGILDGNGTSSVTGPVPDNPLLVGFPLFWQGAVGFDFKLTNAEETRFTDL